MIYPLVHSLEVSDLVFMQSRMQGWVLVNCQNRRNCDVSRLGCWLWASQHAAAKAKAPITHSIKDESPHLLLQLTNPDMSHFTCTTDSLHPSDAFTNPSLYLLCCEVTSLRSPASCDKLTCCTFNLFSVVLWVFFLEDFLSSPFQTELSFLDLSIVSDCHEREEDSQAPPELEPINLGEQRSKSKK